MVRLVPLDRSVWPHHTIATLAKKGASVMTTPAIERTHAADQHLWDEFPHVVWDGVPVEDIALSDILGAALQVQGIAVAEHRGKAAFRFDVENVLSGGTGRLVFTKGQVLCDVKRYIELNASTSSSRALRASTEGSYDFGPAAWSWAATTGDPGDYDGDVDQILFAYMCAVVEEYSRIDRSDASMEVERRHTLNAIAENLTPGYVLRRPSLGNV